MWTLKLARQDESDQEHWMVSLQRVFYPTLAAIGIPSNVVTFLIFWWRSGLVSRSTTFYLMAICCADTAVLVLIAILELTVKYHSAEPFWSREPWCSLRDVFNYGAFNASTWLVVSLTAERFLAVTTRSLKSRLCTPRAAAWTIAVVLLLSHALAVPYYWAYVSSPVAGRWACVYRPQAPRDYVHSLVVFQTLLSYVLPFAVILLLNGAMLRLIARSNRVHAAPDLRRRAASADAPGAAAAAKVKVAAPLLGSRKRRSVVLLVTVSMTFVLLSVTRGVTQLVLRIRGGGGAEREDYDLPLNVAADLGTMLSLSNAAVNMYLYAATQTKFRREVVTCVKYAFSCCNCRLTLATAAPAAGSI